MKERSFRASDGTVVTVRWARDAAPEVHANGVRVPVDSTLDDGRRLTVRCTDGDPDVLLAGSMLEGSASHPHTTMLRARGVLAFGAALLALFAIGSRGALSIQIALAVVWGVCAAITKPFPRVACLLSPVATAVAALSLLALHDRRALLMLPLMLLWWFGVRPLHAAAALLGRLRRGDRADRR